MLQYWQHFHAGVGDIGSVAMTDMQLTLSLKRPKLHTGPTATDHELTDLKGFLHSWVSLLFMEFNFELFGGDLLYGVMFFFFTWFVSGHYCVTSTVSLILTWFAKYYICAVTSPLLSWGGLQGLPLKSMKTKNHATLDILPSFFSQLLVGFQRV